jgi:hypothetical protein
MTIWINVLFWTVTGIALIGALVVIGKWLADAQYRLYIQNRANEINAEANSMVTITASNHCCGIYEMQGVEYSRPEHHDIQSLIDKTKWDDKHSAIIQFSDTKHGNGDMWMDYLIAKGYRVDKLDLERNPKTGSRIFLYNWFLIPKNKKEAYKLSMVREYSYEQQQEKERPNSKPEPVKPGATTLRRVIRDQFGRFRAGR